MRKTWIQSAGVALIVTSLITGCSKDKSQQTADKDFVNYNEIEVTLEDTQSVPQSVIDLANAINADQQIRFDNISQMIVSDHVAEYNRLENSNIQNSDVLKAISDLVDVTKTITNLSEEKVAYENSIETQVGSILYNKKKVSLVHPITEARLQCYSGTMLNMLINRRSDYGQDYRNKNYVIVFTDGHIFPGQMVEVPRDSKASESRRISKFQLVGIESTASGKGNITPIAANLIPNDVLVYDAEYVALMEVFKKYLKANTSSDLAYSMRSLTAKKYGISMPTAEQAQGIAQQKMANTHRMKERDSDLNASPMAIGVVDVPEGDIERTEVEGVGASSFATIGIDNVGRIERFFQKNFGDYRQNGSDKEDKEMLYYEKTDQPNEYKEFVEEMEFRYQKEKQDQKVKQQLRKKQIIEAQDAAMSKTEENTKTAKKLSKRLIQ